MTFEIDLLQIAVGCIILGIAAFALIFVNRAIDRMGDDKPETATAAAPDETEAPAVITYNGRFIVS